VLLEVARQAQRLVGVHARDRRTVGRRRWRIDGERASDGAVDGDVDQAPSVDDPGRAGAAHLDAAGGTQRPDQAIALDGAEQCRQPVADECRLLVALRAGEIAHAIAQSHLDRSRLTAHRLHSGGDSGRIRRGVADPGTRTLGDTHLGGAAR